LYAFGLQSDLRVKVEFDCIDQGYEPCQQGLMGWMLKIRVQRGVVLEQHDASEGVALSSRRDIRADMSLKKSGDYALEGADFFSGSILLGFRGPGLPLKRERMKNYGGIALSSRQLRRLERQEGGSDGGASMSQHRTAG
jgi:hypothetical protein